MSHYRILAYCVLLALLIGLVGRMDYQDEQDQQRTYCEMVKAKQWPDYLGTYRRECLTPSVARN